MQTEALKSFANFIEGIFTQVKVHLNWPGPGVKVKFPYFALLLVNSHVKRWEQSYIGEHTENSETKRYYINGQIESRVDLHYFAKDGQIKDQEIKLDNIIDIFNSQFASDETGSSNLIVTFGALNLKAAITLTDYQLFHSPDTIQSGERRIIFNLLMDTPSIVKTGLPLIRTIKTDSEIGENVTP